MLVGLWASAAGLRTETRSLNAVADDIANESTPAFKAVFASAVDVRPLQGPATRVFSGGGSEAPAVRRDWSQGTLMMTQRPWDLAVEGAGFFRVRLAGGRTGYTRDGTFGLDGHGTLVDRTGHPVLSVGGSPIVIKPGAGQPSVGPDGTITIAGKAIAQIGLSTFRNPQGLQPGPDAIWTATADSGTARTGAPGAAGFGQIREGALESSNVDMGRSFVAMIEANRNFGLDATAVSVANRMWSLANQIRA